MIESLKETPPGIDTAADASADAVIPVDDDPDTKAGSLAASAGLNKKRVKAGTSLFVKRKYVSYYDC